MITETFQTKREFNNKYPSGFYICSNCGYLTPDSKECMRCGWRADGLFKTMGKGYKYKIISEDTEDEIFKPIEVMKGENNDKRKLKRYHIF